MEKFYVVWVRRKGEVYDICAVSVLPDYIRVSTKARASIGSQLQKRGRAVYAGTVRVGAITRTKSGKDVKASTDYEIGYIGGYSNDGRTVFLDRRFPKILVVGGKKVSTVESIARRHEVVEKWMIDDGFSYPYSHKIATQTERRYVEQLGIGWYAYDKITKKHIRIISKLGAKKIPKNLDMSPYEYYGDLVYK